MISTTQATDYVEQQLSVVLPAFLISAACERVGAVEPDMLAAGYAEHDITLMQALAVAIVAAGGARQLQSQGAPSGASRSFKNRADDLTRMRRQLAALDTAGTLATVVGPDPVAQTALLVVC